MRLIILSLFLMMASLPARSGELRHFQVIFEGFERDFNLYVPTGLEENQEPYPLVFVLHGIASTNELVMEKSRGRFNQLADQYGFLVAYPNGLARHWAVGEGEAAALVLPKRDDLAFLDQVLTLSGQLFPVDRTRIFATGFSLGGQMSFAWACNRPGLVRAVATVAMTLPEFMIETCRDSTPFGVAMIHGTADPAVPYYGGSFPVGPKPRDVFLSHDKTLAFFMAQNGCDPAEYQTLVLDEFDDETSVMRRVWENCAGPSLHSYTILAGGHSWPREDQPLTTRAVVGRVSREITGSDQMWEFFQRFE